MRRLVARFLIVALLASGCASAKPAPPQGKVQEQVARDRAECSDEAFKAAETRPLKEAAQVGGLVGAWLIVEGAAQGAGWGFATGGSRADGAWIGAAVGAGIGTIVGLVVGIKKGVEKHRQYESAYERCLADRGYRASPA